jgi:hypothetical protein
MSESKREYAANYRKPPLHTRFKKGQSGNPRGRPKKNLPALLVAALNEPVFVTIDGERRKITKREAVITQLVNESAGANLRATKMLIDMMKDVEKKTGAEPAAGAASVRPGRQGGDQRRRGADTGSPAARNPGHERGQPGSRDDFFASSQRPGQATRWRLTERFNQARHTRPHPA